MYYSILSSELLSNGYFLFFTNAFIGQDVMIYKHLLFSIFYLKKPQLISNFTVDWWTCRWEKLEVIENRKLFQFQIIIWYLIICELIFKTFKIKIKKFLEIHMFGHR